jgi:hypothetical protein
MTEIQSLLENIQDTDGVMARLSDLVAQEPSDEIARINLESVQKRRANLERRLNDELRVTQSDLVEYHLSQSTNGPLSNGGRRQGSYWISRGCNCNI